MKLLAISDLHLSHEENQNLISEFSDHSNDWLILAGDIGERTEHLKIAFEVLQKKFARLIWVPGNHELWTTPNVPDAKSGQEKYEEMLSVCKNYGVISPEDEYVKLKIDAQEYYIAPLFLLYDYSFRPLEVELSQVIKWAAEKNSVCADEEFLSPNPFTTLSAWCHDRVKSTSLRLKSLPPEVPIVLINHFPLRYDLVRLHKIPRFSPWCGTNLTENWHREFNTKVVVSGHLHVRATDWRDGVRFEEVSLGYPRQRGQIEADLFLREILPASDLSEENSGVLRWTY